MIEVLFLLLILLCSYMIIINTKLHYKVYFLYIIILIPFVMSALLFENIFNNFVFCFLYIIIFYFLNKNNLIILNIGSVKNRLPVALGMSILISGAFYYIISNKINITINNKIKYNDLDFDDNFIYLIFLFVFFIIIYIIGLWGVSRREPKYFNILTKNKYYNNELEKKDD